MKNTLNLIKEKNILYVEDEIELQQNVQNTLEIFFNKVYVANDGEEAYEIYKEEEIDLILLDIDIPKINGIEVAKKIRTKNKDIPIILLTAYSDQKYLFDAIKIKVEEYLIKPFNLEKLLNLFKNIYEIDNKYEDIYTLKDGVIFNQKESLITNKQKENIKLGLKEKKLLSLLISNYPNIVTKNIIDEEVWDYNMSESSYRSLIRNLRQKVGSETIITLPGIGVQILL